MRCFGACEGVVVTWSYRAVAGSHGVPGTVPFPLARATRIISSGRFRFDERTFASVGGARTFPPAKLPCHGAAATGQFHRALALAADADAHQLALASAIQFAGVGALLSRGIHAQSRRRGAGVKVSRQLFRRTSRGVVPRIVRG